MTFWYISWNFKGDRAFSFGFAAWATKNAYFKISLSLQLSKMLAKTELGRHIFFMIHWFSKNIYLQMVALIRSIGIVSSVWISVTYNEFQSKRFWGSNWSFEGSGVGFSWRTGVINGFFGGLGVDCVIILEEL